MTGGDEFTRGGRALVLGAGGVLGSAWTVGALRAWEVTEGRDPRDADVVVGTSAGSVIAAMIAGGLSTEVLLEHQRGGPAASEPTLAYDHDHAVGGALPRLPRPRLGSRKLLRRSLRRTRRDPVVAFYACLPEGRGTLTPISDLVGAVHPDGTWPDLPALRVVGTDYDTGARVVFGDDGAPPAAVRDAVTASCAAPCWFAPVHIDGRRYVDGGVVSASSLDLLAGRGLDEVVLLAPMAAFAYDRPRSPLRRAEHAWRRMVTRRLLADARKVRESGTPVRLFAPGPDDLRAIGANLMNPSRRKDVLETSLRTTAEVLRRGGLEEPLPTG